MRFGTSECTLYKQNLFLTVLFIFFPISTGDTILHAWGDVTMVQWTHGTWMVEYGRGFIPSTMPFALSGTLTSTQDIWGLIKVFRMYIRFLWQELVCFVNELSSWSPLFWSDSPYLIIGTIGVYIQGARLKSLTASVWMSRKVIKNIQMAELFYWTVPISEGTDIILFTILGLFPNLHVGSSNTRIKSHVPGRHISKRLLFIRSKEHNVAQNRIKDVWKNVHYWQPLLLQCALYRP